MAARKQAADNAGAASVAPAPVTAPDTVATSYLIAVHKDGEVLRVHPDLVAVHVAHGWRVED